MKKLLVVLIVAISLLSLTSCEDYAVKVDYEQETNNINHDEVGEPNDDDDDLDLDTIG